jgi:GNAT superfamily N-acetyltransferase
MQVVPMNIAPAHVENAPEILALQRLAYQSEAAVYDNFTLPPLTETLEALTARFGDRKFLKAIDEGRIVGSVRGFQEGTTLFVERLIVHPEQRRRGLGTALLGRIESLFPAARRFELFTGHKSLSNLRLYERLGYREFRREAANEKVVLVYLAKNCRVREFRPGDAATFQRLNEEWITRYFALEEKDRKLFGDPEGRILAPGGTILVLEADGEPVGCCALIPRDAETLEVAKMAVTGEHQGKGLGRILLHCCIDRARFQGARRLYLETNSKLLPAVSLYRALGFVDVPRSRWPASEYARVDLVMELRL